MLVSCNDQCKRWFVTIKISCLCLLTIFCVEALLTACLDAGGLPVCERARVRFEDDQKVQQHALVAIQNMTGEHVASGSECGIQ